MPREPGERATCFRAVLAHVSGLLRQLVGQHFLDTMLHNVLLEAFGATDLLPAVRTGEPLGWRVDLHVYGAVGLFEEPHPAHGASNLPVRVVDGEMLSEASQSGEGSVANFTLEHSLVLVLGGGR